MNLTFVFMSIIKTMNDNNNVIIDAMDWIGLIQLNIGNNKQRFKTKHSNNIFKYLKEGQESSQNE
jgi:hypothetical protein